MFSRDISSSKVTIVIVPITVKMNPKSQIAPYPICRAPRLRKKSATEYRKPISPCQRAAKSSIMSNERQSGFAQRADTKSKVVSDGTLR